MPGRETKKSNRAVPDPKVSHSRYRNALSAADWINAAEDLLMENNVNTIDIPHLCKRLGVTKGSFYWHFSGRVDLVLAILDEWRHRTTRYVKDRASHIDSSSDSALRDVLAAICKPQPNRNTAIERSVRDWARTDPRARTAVGKVDQIRLVFLQQLFQRNFCEEEAQIRAYAAYAIMMGDSILRETISPSDQAEEHISKFVELLLGAEERADSNRSNKNNHQARHT